MTNPKSFEHVKTIYSFDSTTKDPFMFVRCIFNGSNVYGGIVEHMISAKVDEKQKRYMIVLTFLVKSCGKCFK